jgi:hypothetical protein
MMVSINISLSHLYRWNEGRNSDTGCSYFPTFVEMLSDGKESVCFPRLSPDGSKLVRTRYCIKIKLCGCMYSRICYIIAVYQLTMTARGFAWGFHFWDREIETHCGHNILIRKEPLSTPPKTVGFLWAVRFFSTGNVGVVWD